MNEQLKNLLGYGFTKQEIYEFVARLECDLLVIIFVVLKLTGHIRWEWWSIFTPTYILWAINVLKIYLLKSTKKGQRDAIL